MAESLPAGVAVPSGVRLVGRRLRLSDFVVFVRAPESADEVRVRVRQTRGGRVYRCDACGPANQPRCAHALAASRIFRPTFTH